MQLNQEWATTADISVTGATKEVDSLLLAARPTYTGTMGAVK